MQTISETLNLALQHHQAGRLDEAEALFRQALQIQPNHPDPLHGLGVIAYQLKQYDRAVEYLRRAIEMKPEEAEYHNHLGAAYRAQGRLDEAAAAYRQALALNPSNGAACYNLGNVLKEQGRLDEAVACLRRALALNPAYAEAHNNLGLALLLDGKIGEAIECFRRALSFSPDSAEAYNNLGLALHEECQFDEAIASYRLALSIKPDSAEAHSNLALTLQDQGKISEAEDSFRQALACNPGYVAAHSNLLMCMCYDPDCDSNMIAAEHRKWNDRHARSVAPRKVNYSNSRDADRRLRVGYVSADFRGHAVKYFFEPLLAAHDHANVEVVCYSNVLRMDAATDRLQALADVWRNIVGLTDEAVVERIIADKIDILVDLSNHTAGNRLLVFARKPAPVQVAYFGTALTTGLTTMDYRLTDGYLSPPDSPEWSSEELVRLSPCLACYRPPEEAPPVSPLPALTNGCVTFGCFNNMIKVLPNVVRLWSEILRQVPKSRLILKDRTMADIGQRARYMGLFRDNGIPAEHIELLPQTSFADYLATYRRVDIALDPFPYNGCTTTCESLWMGVPVVTLAGVMANGRMGVTLLSSAGLSRLIASTPEEYVRIAVELANNQQELSALRAELRPRMAASPLCDAASLARNVEQAYRTMWRTWCEEAR